MNKEQNGMNEPKTFGIQHKKRHQKRLTIITTDPDYIKLLRLLCETDPEHKVYKILVDCDECFVMDTLAIMMCMAFGEIKEM